jgi:hypothetical protein
LSGCPRLILGNTSARPKTASDLARLIFRYQARETSVIQKHRKNSKNKKILKLFLRLQIKRHSFYVQKYMHLGQYNCLKTTVAN